MGDKSTRHAAPHGGREEVVLVLDVEVLQAVLLERRREELGLRADHVLAGVEVLGDAGEESPRRRARRQVVGLDGQLDVQHLRVHAQHFPGHVHLHEHQLVVHHLGGGWRGVGGIHSFIRQPIAKKCFSLDLHLGHLAVAFI